MPIILQSGLISNLFTVSQLLHDKFKYNFLVNLYGNFDNGTPIGGLVYWISRPEKLYSSDD